MATPDDSNHAAIPLRSATTDSKTPYNYALTHKHTQSSLKPPLQWGQKKANRPQPHSPHRRGTCHRQLQPLHTEKHKVSFSGFLPKTKPTQHSCSHYNAFCSIPFITSSLPHHFPSSPLAFITTSHRHHVPSSPHPIVTTSLRHHFLPFVTTLCHSFLFFCYVLLDDVPPGIISSLRILFARNTEVLLPNFL